MAGCCDPRGCQELFGPRFARHLASRYRRRGLDATAARIVGIVTRHGVDGATVLEVGGGVGDLQLELLRLGAVHATNLELVDAYEPEAARLAAAAGLGERITRRVVDIAVDPASVAAADVVVLNRVVCCYPDYERLLAAAADHARRLLVFSHPPRTPVTRALVSATNAGFRLRGRSFRNYTHSPAAMVAVAEARGLHASYDEGGRIWRVVGLTRAAR